jgi:type I restriction enzyme S subunit
MTQLEKYPAYKNSGVEWLGEIPAGWSTDKGKWLFIQNDRPVRKEDDIVTCYRDGQVTLRSNRRTDGFTNALKEHGYQGIRKGDLVIHAMDAFAGAIGVSDSDGKSTPVYSACTPFFVNKVDSFFYAYLLRNMAHTGFIESLAKGIRERSTDFRYNDFANLQFPLPSLPEQTAIAAFLDEKTTKIDTAIAQKEQMISLLKERKQILIQNAVTKGLNPDAKMKDSGVEWIGDIPEEWAILPNKVLFQESKIGGDDSLPLLSVSLHTGVSSGELDAEENIRGKVKIEDKSSYKRVKPQYIAYNMMRAWQGAIGAVSIEGMVSPAYVVAIPNEKVIDSVYFEFQYRTSLFIQQMSRFSKGITDFRKRLYWNEFKQLNTIVPPLNVQQEIVVFITTQSAKIDTSISLQQQQIAKLKEYKSTLIDSAVTGKIKVC